MTAIVVTAQETEEETKDEIQTIFSALDLEFTGGYITPEVKFGKLHEDYALMVGGRIGTSINDNFVIGLGGYGLTTDNDFAFDTVNIGMGYGGLFLEYVFFSNKAVHFSIPVMIGAGGFTLYEAGSTDIWDSWDDWDNWDNWDNELENTAAFIIEPGISLEVNLTKFMRMNLGASYRLVQFTALDRLSDQDLSCFAISFGLKFGFF